MTHGLARGSKPSPTVRLRSTKYILAVSRKTHATNRVHIGTQRKLISPTLCKAARRFGAFATSLVRTVPPVLSLAKDLYYNTLITASAVVITLNRMSIVRPPNIKLRLVSPSSRSLSQTSHVYAFAAWCMKEVISAVRSRSFPALQGMLAIVP